MPAINLPAQSFTEKLLCDQPQGQWALLGGLQGHLWGEPAGGQGTEAGSTQAWVSGKTGAEVGNSCSQTGSRSGSMGCKDQRSPSRRPDPGRVTSSVLKSPGPGSAAPIVRTGDRGTG